MTPGIGIAIWIMLAAVFATSGLAKLMHQEGSRRALLHFGVPAHHLSYDGSVVTWGWA